jgi:hypothetical protein
MKQNRLKAKNVLETRREVFSFPLSCKEELAGGGKKGHIWLGCSLIPGGLGQTGASLSLRTAH